MKLISVTGPESTGKSSLAEALAKHFQSVWVREYAREYLAGLNRKYGYSDILSIARGQLRKEQEMAVRAEKYMFCDTDMLVCKIWSSFKYGKVDPWINDMVRTHRYDLYLLCDIDLPWANDPLREHPHRRQELYDLYLYELKKQGVRFEIISGYGSYRLQKAISAVEKTFSNETGTKSHG